MAEQIRTAAAIDIDAKRAAEQRLAGLGWDALWDASETAAAALSAAQAEFEQRRAVDPTAPATYAAWDAVIARNAEAAVILHAIEALEDAQ